MWDECKNNLNIIVVMNSNDLWQIHSQIIKMVPISLYISSISGENNVGLF